MTNVSAVEKMAELMQQMEENSPRVAAFQYCLKQVAEKVEEAEKRNAELQARCEALAAENALLKKSEPAPFSKLMMEALDVYQAGADEVPELAMLSAYKKLREGLKTPATEAILAEVRAQGRNEGINYAASRLAAAYNHGFIGKSMSEVADVVHMILDTKEELANSTLPAADGLSGEYAEEFLEDSAAQIRQEAAQ
ncbi:TPA: hypothetical protein ACOEAI_000193 [Enterobacter hormaechei subsp. xiangfangensis]|uniref:hypothetical protein n=1 Tax=Enterobacter hormaechei TaxID=158836 RepID=UPI001E2E7578|nr:hypothetical protein [Enterobacter hormaechei]MCE1929020.1 hypothetical protein [Enterobacter hormaechei]